MIPGNLLARCCATLCLILFQGLEAATAVHPWDRFRGPNGQGISESADPPVELGQEENLKWRVAVPEGYSSAVVWRDRVFLTGLEDDCLAVVRLDAGDGSIRWKRIVQPPIVATNYRTDNGHRVSSTPAVDGERLVVYSFHLGLLAYDHEGKLLWERKLPPPDAMFCPATSPIIHESRVYLCLDGEKGGPPQENQANTSRLYAFDARDGTLIWETARPFGSLGYSTPVIWERESASQSGPELVVFGGKRLAGYDLGTGSLNWWVGGFPIPSNTTPTLGGGMVFVGATDLLGFSSEKYEGPGWDTFLTFDTNNDGKVALEGELPDDFKFETRQELPTDTPGYAVFPFKSFASSDDSNQDGFFTKDEFEKMVKGIEGLSKPLVLAVRPQGKGDVTESSVVWRKTRGMPEAPSMLYYRDRLYAVKDGGLVTCTVPDSGEILYTERLGAGGLYTASPVAAAGRLYFCSAKGDLTVVSAGDTFNVLARASLQEDCYATPALVGNRLYLRTLRNLYAFESPPAAP